MPEIKFVASLPPVQSAIKVSGNGDGARITLEIPESELAEAIKLMLFRGKTFDVVIRDAL